MSPSRALAMARHCLLVSLSLQAPCGSDTSPSVSRSLDKLGNLLEGTVVQGGGRRGSNPALSEHVLLLLSAQRGCRGESGSCCGGRRCAVTSPG